MGTTTFTGPIRAGNILNTSGNIPGNNVANVGQVVMAQSYPFTESSAAITTTISIPANSQILSITFYASVTFTNSVSVGIAANPATGAPADPTYYSAATAVSAGVSPVTPTTAGQQTNWIDTGYPDTQVTINGGAAPGAGVGVLTIQYLQGPNGNT